MQPRFLLLGSLIVLPALTLAQETQPVVSPVAAAVAQPAHVGLPPITNNTQVDEAIRGLQSEWADIKYQEKNPDTQTGRMKKLADKATQIQLQYPNYPEIKIWHAIILSTVAGMDGGLGALDYAKQAKSLLEESIKANPNALDGSAYTSLGTLYYKVPAWPIAFGDNAKARAYLEQARAINPDGIDPNYFYGDFLLGTGHAKDAIPVLEHALQAAPRPGREVADAGRRQEINEALTKAREEAK